MENLIKNIYQAKIKKEELEKKINDLKAEMEQVDNYIEECSNDLLNQMKTSETKMLEVENLVAETFSKENIGYTSDKDVLDYLKANGYNQYVKTKVTESLDKTPLKKAIKTDEVLAKGLDDLTVRTLTEYVVVTTKENHEKMLEHIEGKK